MIKWNCNILGRLPAHKQIMPSVNLIKIHRELCWIGPKIDCIALGMMAGITQILQEIILSNQNSSREMEL